MRKFLFSKCHATVGDINYNVQGYTKILIKLRFVK